MSLNDADSQHIDFNGKARILNFDGVSIAISPLPPLNIPEVPKSKTNFATLSRALELANELLFEIVEKDVDIIDAKEILKGLWVRSTKKMPEIAFGYIPIEDGNSNDPRIENIPISHETLIDPIFVEGVSYLDEMRANEKVAEYLKQLSIYEWSQNPDKFGKRNFVVYEGIDYTNYGITEPQSNRIDFRINHSNGHFYDRSKIIVPNDKTIDRLLSFVNVSALNDSHLQENTKNRSTLNQQPFYTNVKDFEPHKDQYIFIGKGSLVSWLTNTQNSINSQNNPDINIVHAHPLENEHTPYYYRNMLIKNGRLCLIQNTHKSDFPSALAVSKEWVESGVNVGYFPENYPGGIYIDENHTPSYEVYTTEGMTYSINGSTTEIYTIFGYNSGAYAAILFL